MGVDEETRGGGTRIKTRWSISRTHCRFYSVESFSRHTYPKAVYGEFRNTVVGGGRTSCSRMPRDSATDVEGSKPVCFGTGRCEHPRHYTPLLLKIRGLRPAVHVKYTSSDKAFRFRG